MRTLRPAWQRRDREAAAAKLCALARDIRERTKRARQARRSMRHFSGWSPGARIRPSADAGLRRQRGPVEPFYTDREAQRPLALQKPQEEAHPSLSTNGNWWVPLRPKEQGRAGQPRVSSEPRS